MNIESITQRIVELRQRRDEFLRQANQQLGELSGRIAELERLLEELKGETDGNGQQTS